MNRPYSFFPFGAVLVALLGLSIASSAFAAYDVNVIIRRRAAQWARAWTDYISTHNTLSGEQLVLALDILFSRALHISEQRALGHFPSEGETEDDAIIFPQVIWVQASPDEDLGAVFAGLGEMGGEATAGYLPKYRLHLSSPEDAADAIFNVTKHGTKSELIVLDSFADAQGPEASLFVESILRTLDFERTVVVVDRFDLYAKLKPDLKNVISHVGENGCSRHLSDPNAP